MRILLENAKTYELHNHELKFININMDDDLLDKLKKCKISPSESYSDAINRLLDEKIEYIEMTNYCLSTVELN